MNYSRPSIIGFLVLLIPHYLPWNYCSAQTQIIRAIEYRQISSFVTNMSITSMKMSADGSKIVFATGGPAVRVFTINSNGSGLKQVYDFQKTGFGPFVDISANGSKVIWCDYAGDGAIFVADADGSAQQKIVTRLPHPDPVFADMRPDIPFPPRITADGGQVSFVHLHRDPRGAGVWRINSNGSNLQHVFDYLTMSQKVFGRNGSEYEWTAAFTDGFDISGSGGRMIVGTRIFRLEKGDRDRGDAIVVDGSAFYHLGEYAIGTQPFATYKDGDRFIMFKREYNTVLKSDETNVYFVAIGTGNPTKVVSGLDIFGTAAAAQMAGDGSRAIVLGDNGRLPITLVDRVAKSRVDLVSIDGISTAALGGFRFSESSKPSINWNGNQFCFLSPSNPPQIWVAKINSDATLCLPSITEISLNPGFVLLSRSTTAAFKARVTSPPNTIHTVSFGVMKEGAFRYRALSTDWPYNGNLVDNGGFGDTKAGDGYFCNNSVRADLPETPAGSYAIRLAAVNSTLREVTMVDAEPFSILDQPSSIEETAVEPTAFKLHQNYPNPFNPSTIINYTVPTASFVAIRVYDNLGKEIATLLNKSMPPGNYKMKFDTSNLSSGVYFCRMISGSYAETRKMVLLR